MSPVPEPGTFLMPWIPVTDPEEAEGLLRELKAEVGPKHALYGMAFRTVARRVDTDDALFEVLPPGSGYAMVHLTWGPKPDPHPQWPDSRAYPDWESVCRGELLPDHEEWNRWNPEDS